MSLTSQKMYSPRAKDANIDKSGAVKRLQKELMELMMCTDKSISAFPDGENLFRYVLMFFHFLAVFKSYFF